MADPRPLTPDRVAELVAAIQADDPNVAYWAKVELDHDRDEHERWRQSQEWADLDDSCTPEHRAVGDGPCHHEQWATSGTLVPL